MTGKLSSAKRTAVVLAASLLPPVAIAFAVHALWPAPEAAAPARTTSSIASAGPAENRTPEIRGHILDADGNPVQSAAVRLVSTGPPYKVYRDAISDAAGAFSFARVGLGTLSVVADRDPQGFVSSGELHVGAGQSEEVTLVLSAANGVRGIVMDDERRPVAGATLSVEGIPWKVPSATTDASGAFRMVIVPDQVASIRAVARGYRPAHVALDARDPRVELVVRVQLSVATSVVQGEVLADDGEPVAAQVVACSGQSSQESVASAEDGSFELPPSTIGCDAVAHLAGYASSEPATIVDGRRVELRLKTGGGIEGVVLDERGSGVPEFSLGIEAYVSTRGGPPDRGPRGFNDARGAFRWDKLAPGRYVLTASTEGKPPARSAPIAVEGGVVTRGVRIVVGQGGSVSGVVYDDRHAPISDADVGLDVVSSIVPGAAATRTDASGRYHLDGAPSGRFTLRAQKAGFRTRLVSGLRVASAGALSQDITLSASSGGAGGGGPGGLELGGIGAYITPTDDGIVLGGLGAGDPAARAGLQEGDRILSIDGESSESMSVADAIQRLRGDVKTKVDVSVERPNSGQLLDVTIVRGLIVR